MSVASPSSDPKSSDSQSPGPQVTMYSTAFCGYCDRARSLLTRKGASVVEIKVDEDPTDREAMLKRTNGQRTVPQIFIGDRHVGGFTDLAALDRSGELDALLAR